VVAPYVLIKDRVRVGPLEQLLNVLITCWGYGPGKYM
jgi:hypothetical protein